MTTDPQTRPPDPPPSSGVLRFALTAGAWCIGLFGLMRVGLEFVIRPPLEAGPCPGSGRSNVHG